MYMCRALAPRGGGGNSAPATHAAHGSRLAFDEPARRRRKKRGAALAGPALEATRGSGSAALGSQIRWGTKVSTGTSTGTKCNGVSEHFGYSRLITWWAGLDSNQRPRDYESPALTELSYRPVALNYSARKPEGPLARPLVFSFPGRGSFSIARTATGGAACAAPWPRSGVCARASRRTACRPLPACGRSTSRCRSACAAPSPLWA